MKQLFYSGLMVFAIWTTALAEPSALETAVRADDAEAITRLLADGADPETRAESGAPMLVIAASRGRTEAVALLLEAGANPDATVSDGSNATALMYASGGKDDQIARQLLAAGADVNLRDNMGDPAINWAAYYGNTQYVGTLLDAGADATLRGHGNAFEIALRRGHEDILRMTAEATGNLHARSEHEAEVGRLLQAGDDAAAAAAVRSLPESRRLESDSYGRPLLQVAAVNGGVSTIETILARGESVDAPDVIGFTALMHAAREGRLDAAKTLLAAGADVNHRGAETGLSLCPLHLAAVGGSEPMVTLLIEAGANPDAQGREGGTALRWAMYEGQQATAMALVAAGADVDLTSERAQSPRKLAELMGWQDMVALIAARDAQNR